MLIVDRVPYRFRTLCGDIRRRMHIIPCTSRSPSNVIGSCRIIYMTRPMKLIDLWIYAARSSLDMFLTVYDHHV
jgi:hypothetical protein